MQYLIVASFHVKAYWLSELPWQCSCEACQKARREKTASFLDSPRIELLARMGMFVGSEVRGVTDQDINFVLNMSEERVDRSLGIMKRGGKPTSAKKMKERELSEANVGRGKKKKGFTGRQNHGWLARSLCKCCQQIKETRGLLFSCAKSC